MMIIYILVGSGMGGLNVLLVRMGEVIVLELMWEIWLGIKGVGVIMG